MERPEPYTATYGVVSLFLAINNEPAQGTGIIKLVNITKNFSGKIPQALVDFEVDHQLNLFGSYPTSKDIAPLAIFVAAFSVIALAHLFVFIVNLRRGHFFWLSLGWVFYSIMRVLGFGLRIKFANDITYVLMGITLEVLLILPSIILDSLNLILAQRIFTWRHPVGGSRKLFWGFMFGLYGLVLALIGMTIACAAVPYIYFLSAANYRRYQHAVQALGVLILLYTLTAIALVGLAYFFKPTRKDENLYTYQPWWIESFSPFYFVRKGAASEAQETFMKRNHNHRHAIRVIAATHHHYKLVEGLTNQRGTLEHNISLMIIFVTTLLLLVGALCRLVSLFQARMHKDASLICAPVAMYICWGFFEFVINVLYLVGRVDLRFYRPDRLLKKVRAIITAEQSIEQSDALLAEYETYTTEEEYTDEEMDSFDLTQEHKRQNFMNEAGEKDFEVPLEPSMVPPARLTPQMSPMMKEKDDEEFHF